MTVINDLNVQSLHSAMILNMAVIMQMKNKKIVIWENIKRSSRNTTGTGDALAVVHPHNGCSNFVCNKKLSFLPGK